jgi:two-component system, OmpR family, alkaline phosphatase synthesis response regulator PhoP
MDPTVYKILLVDDEPDILEFLSYNLIKEGFSVLLAKTGKEALDMVLKERPHLILLDMMMPGMDGVETCEHIREIPGTQDILIAFLTARGEDYSQIAGFEAGADDYITKPVRPKVLVSRIKALLKRIEVSKNTREDDESVDIRVVKGELVIDRQRYLVIIDGQEITLPRKEFELLALLSSKPECVINRAEIFSSVWGDDIIVGDRTIDVHIRKLREKIGEDRIKTIKGVGYKYTT